MGDSLPGRFTEPDLPAGSQRGATAIKSWLWPVIYIIYSLEVGFFLLFLPWLAIWENNYILYRYPQLRPILANSFLKGAVLGLGIVNILIGIEEIANFKKHRKKTPSS